MSKVSVILPSLNVREYIVECIESVINQTLHDIEIICIDAGSTDGTLEVLRRYAENDRRINVIVSDKKSYGYQMNLGLDAASGKYIGIVETDDYVLPNMFEELYEIAEKNESDFVKSDFYRFKGKGANLSKAYYKLAPVSYYYNRNWDIAHCQESIGFVMNIWSGIYSLEFIRKNNIRFNETPGASYQDNGFWFQTFMYAKKAFFVDKAFYMNRRDNPGSSVHSKSKVFCICEEYNFLYDIIKANKMLLNEFGFSFVFASFQAYKGNLNRIGDEYKESFIMRWSEDFRKYRDAGLLDYKKYDATDWEMIHKIIENPCEYYKESVLKEILFLEEIRYRKNIIIYGAGMIGKRLYEKLVYQKEPADVISFAVTKKEDNYDSYRSIPIKKIEELLEYRKNGYVIIGTTPLYQNEIEEKLKSLGFEHIRKVPYVLPKDEKYYRELSQEERTIELKMWYARITGNELDLTNPTTFNEKIQYLKLHDDSELKRKLSDKLELRNWVKQQVGEDYLSELFGAYKKMEDIPYATLPKQFSIRCIHNDFKKYVEDKKDIERYNWKTISRRVNNLLSHNHAYTESAELWYRETMPGVLVEVLPAAVDQTEIYKVVCVNQTAKYIIKEKNRECWDCKKRDFYDCDWNHLDIRLKYPNAEEKDSRPAHLHIMIDVAERVCKGLDLGVVFLFDTSEGVIFEDLRFTLGSGVEYGNTEDIFI